MDISALANLIWNSNLQNLVKNTQCLSFSCEDFISYFEISHLSPLDLMKQLHPIPTVLQAYLGLLLT